MPDGRSLEEITQGKTWANKISRRDLDVLTRPVMQYDALWYLHTFLRNIIESSILRKIFRKRSVGVVSPNN